MRWGRSASGGFAGATTISADWTGRANPGPLDDLADSALDRRLTLGGDKAFDAREFVDHLRHLHVTPHVAQNTSNRASAIDGRTTRHDGYALSQKKRKLIEEPFGWAKTIGGLARPMLRGAARLGFKFTLTMAAYDLIRLPKLLGAAA